MTIDSPTENLNPNNWIPNYYQFLFNYTRSRVADDYTTQEIIQETFLSALKSAKNFQNKSTERTWLTSILRYKIIDHYRKNNSYKGSIEKTMISNEEYEAMNFSEIPDNSFTDRMYYDDNYAHQIRQSILDSIEKLPKKQSKVFKMKAIDNVENKVICEKLNITESNLWVLMYRAKRNLATHLKPMID